MENKTKLKLGPIQTQWLADLRANGHLQMKNQLGKVDEKGEIIGLCCLGQFIVTRSKCLNIENIILNSDLYSYSISLSSTSIRNFESYGLINEYGYCNTTKGIVIGDNKFTSLANANDGGVTWKELADIIEANPENFFTHAV